ncbi:thioredoxin family protein [Flavobacteriaceae bacterium F08102]|nr:thioredoxin family protein [Flavobacteriaceae bacterium F08102]
MKKTLLLFVAVVSIQWNSTAQQKITITQQRPVDLVGIKEKSDLQQAPYTRWFNQNYNQYSLDEVSISKIKKHLKGITIKGFMGTWCEDSKREIPRFYKIMETTGFNLKNFELIAVNHAKKTPDNLQEGLHIIRVPTLIFYKNNKEIGRIVEYPRETLEKDIAKIISGQPYKHAYDHH